jgi:hypothetical protein
MAEPACAGPYIASLSFHRMLGERMGVGLYRIDIVALNGLFEVGHRVLD